MTTKMTDDERKAWRAIRKEAGLKIDPETAEVYWEYAQTLDPYGIYPDLPKECDQVGREYFARSPGGDVWVSFDDLPKTTRDALWEKHRSKLGFPAGLLLPFRSAALRSALIQSPKKDDDELAVFGDDQGEFGIVGKGCFLQARIEQAPRIIEKLRAILREVGADGA